MVEFIIKEVVKGVMNISDHLIKEKIIKKDNNSLKDFVSRIKQRTEIHLNEITNWAKVNYYLNAVSENSILNTIELNLNFYKSFIEREFTEKDIINHEKNIILTGSPGAGKTTTIKRISHSLFSKINKRRSKFKLPILLRFRNFKTDSFLEEILLVLGIPFVKRDEENKIIDSNYDKIPKKIKYFVGEELADRFLGLLFNKLKVIVFLDGLDEYKYKLQAKVMGEIDSLAGLLKESKIILTTRNTALLNGVENFDTFSIRPLNSKQIQKLCFKVLNGEAENFVKKVKTKTYFDLIDRPIFLMLLILIFKQTSNLPSKATDIYEEATLLLLKNWDYKRNVVRLSQFSEFEANRILEFLSELSYNLTYKEKEKQFNKELFIDFYNTHYEYYNLPEKKASEVAQVIESQNGIIHEVDRNIYEFSHLSIQEYLCARYLVKTTHSKRIYEYFNSYPEPLAIAVCIASNPSEWISTLILNRNVSLKHVKELSILINRLILEHPQFRLSIPLGITSLFIIKCLGFSDKSDVVWKYLELKNVKESIAIALPKFVILSKNKALIKIKKKEVIFAWENILIPEILEIPIDFITYLVEKKSISINNKSFMQP